ncbi:hypothetical protein JXA34_01625 [Patescibacteria group bacterium]|nr:hypothetical protein [Patescibacteria group bacterium]
MFGRNKRAEVEVAGKTPEQLREEYAGPKVGESVLVTRVVEDGNGKSLTLVDVFKFNRVKEMLDGKEFVKGHALGEGVIEECAELVRDSERGRQVVEVPMANWRALQQLNNPYKPRREYAQLLRQSFGLVIPSRATLLEDKSPDQVISATQVMEFLRDKPTMLRGVETSSVSEIITTLKQHEIEQK